MARFLRLEVVTVALYREGPRGCGPFLDPTRWIMAGASGTLGVVKTVNEVVLKCKIRLRIIVLPGVVPDHECNCVTVILVKVLSRSKVSQTGL